MATLIVVGSSPPLGAAPVPELPLPTAAYIIHDATAAEVRAVGGEIIDEYGAFIHALLSTDEESALRALGGRLEPFSLRLQKGAFSAGDDIPPDLQSASSSRYWVVAFRGPVKADWITVLRARSELVESFDQFSIVVRGDDPSELSELQGVERVFPFHPAFRISESALDAIERTEFRGMFDSTLQRTAIAQDLSNAGAEVTSISSNEHRHLATFFAEPTGLRGAARIEGLLWIEPSNRGGGLDLDRASAVIQSNLTGNYSVNYHVKGGSQTILVCDVGLSTTQDTAYTGTKVVRFDHSAIDRSDSLDPLVGKIEYNAHLQSTPATLPLHPKVKTFFSPSNGSEVFGDTVNHAIGHGTYTTTIAAGDVPTLGTRDTYDGVALGASLAICDIAEFETIGVPPAQTTVVTQHLELDDEWDYYRHAYFNASARIASISFGGTATQAYTLKSREHDQMIWDHRDLVIVRSTGNDALVAIRPQAIAKNVLGVGMSGNRACNDPPPADQCQSPGDPENVHVKSNHGPTGDGRIKPNVVAPGACVIAWKTPTQTKCTEGTSFATPQVAGAAALIRDYFSKGFYPTGVEGAGENRSNVSSALVRGMIMASAVHLRNLTVPNVTDNVTIYPSPQAGWGRPVLENILNFSNDSHTQNLLVVDEWESESLTTGEDWEKQFRVMSGREVRVFLSWTDYPGSLGSGQAILNDIDLRVSGPDCLDTFSTGPCLGNAFNGTETDDGKDRLPDRLNNMEAVYLCRPGSLGECDVATGVYTIRVSAFGTLAYAQPFTLVITGDVRWE